MVKYTWEDLNAILMKHTDLVHRAERHIIYWSHGRQFFHERNVTHPLMFLQGEAYKTFHRAQTATDTSAMFEWKSEDCSIAQLDIDLTSSIHIMQLSEERKQLKSDICTQKEIFVEHAEWNQVQHERLKQQFLEMPSDIVRCASSAAAEAAAIAVGSMRVPTSGEP